MVGKIKKTWKVLAEKWPLFANHKKSAPLRLFTEGPWIREYKYARKIKEMR